MTPTGRGREITLALTKKGALRLCAATGVAFLLLPAPEARQEISGVDGKPCAPALRP